MSACAASGPRWAHRVCTPGLGSLSIAFGDRTLAVPARAGVDPWPETKGIAKDREVCGRSPAFRVDLAGTLENRIDTRISGASNVC